MSGYDDWKLAGPGERASDARHTGTCQTCGCDCYGKPPRSQRCAGCGAVMCEECEKAHRCECGKVFCEGCVERIDGLWLCAECKVNHFEELGQLELVRVALNVRAARTVPEKQVVAFSWAVDRVFGRCALSENRPAA
jgi:hypothetical protein